MTMQEYVTASLVFLIATLTGLFLLLSIEQYLNLPIVGKSVTGECVYIIEKESKQTCPKSLPKRYILEYVG